MSTDLTCMAVLGTGNIGMRHLSVLQAIEGVSIIAVPKRPERTAELTKLGHATAASLKQAVSMGATHCVIASDTGQHLEDGLLALESGLDVLMEKPLATDAGGAALLREKAASLERHLFVACVLRFSESLACFRELLNSVGPLHHVRIESQSYLPQWRPGRPYQESFRARATEGGVLLDLIHEIDYAGWIFGWPDRIEGRLKNLNRLGIEAEESADLIWDSPQGATVSVTLDYLSQPPHRRMTAYGELGTIEWHENAGKVSLHLDGAQTKEVVSSQSRDQAFSEQTRAFLDLKHGVSDPRLATAKEGVSALAVCDAARQSSQSRCEEAVEYV